MTNLQEEGNPFAEMKQDGRMYRIKDCLLLIFLFLLVLGPTSAKASFIRLETQINSTYDGKRFKVGVEVTNRGDEPAYNVQVNGEVNGQMLTTPAKDSLGVNEKYSTDAVLDTNLAKNGKYPVIVKVDYTDANQYPFSAISINHVVYGKNVTSQMFGIFKNIEISSEGILNLSLKSLSEQEEKVTVRLILPRELSSPNLSKTISLKAKSEDKVNFEVKNFSALPGSVYSVYAIMEYDEGDTHYSSSVGGNISIQKEGGFVKSNRTLLIGIAVILVVLFAYLNLKSLRSRKAGKV